MTGQFQLIHGNSLEVLKTLPSESIHAAVTDPPYELGFMGRKWDASGIAYNVELWKQLIRVLKPGAHLAAFGGTRTYHRMACAIEDAGFDVRDQLAWAYGSGFPKSLDVAKAIDAADRIGMSRERSLRFTAWMRTTGITAAEINQATSSSMASHYLTAKEQPEVATEEMFSKLRPLIAARGHVVPDEIEELVRWRTVEYENLKKRRVVGTKTATDLSQVRPVSIAAQGLNGAPRREINLTEPHTKAAKAWEGWGTALKPAWEPICLARKPFKGSVAECVAKNGTAALNVDGCRVPYADAADAAAAAAAAAAETLRAGKLAGDGWGMKPQDISATDYLNGSAGKGRWPANILHDGSPEVVACFPDDGFASAARFFYTAKASTYDREAGLDGFDRKTAGELTNRKDGSDGLKSPRAGAGASSKGGRANIHPTVKPTDLMVWLVRMLTPKGGTVIDPFMGSGSTGRAAAVCNMNFIGIDMTAEYIPIAKARIDEARGELFAR